jgi:hypothetical protein
MMVAVRPAAVALTEEVGLTAAGETGEGPYVEFYYHHTYYFVPRTSGITVSLAEILQKLGGGLPSIDDVASVVATGRMSNYIYPSKAESGNDWNVTIDDELVEGDGFVTFDVRTNEFDASTGAGEYQIQVKIASDLPPEPIIYEGVTSMPTPTKSPSRSAKHLTLSRGARQTAYRIKATTT